MMSIIHYVYSQFGEPRGTLGRLAGYIMANRPSNIERNDWALSLLEIKPADRILEIGFGPGIAAGKAAAQASEVVGIDRSALMVHQAARRNKELAGHTG
jgi:SAM-dependent methyltransferase